MVSCLQTTIEQVRRPSKMTSWIIDEARAVLSAVLKGLEMAVRHHEDLTGLYDQAFIKSLTEHEAKTLAQLHRARDAIFKLICEELASSVGYDKTSLSEEQKADVAKRADELIRAGRQAEHLAEKPALFRLLNKHHELTERIVAILEEVINRMRSV